MPNAPTIYISGMPYDNENPTQNITDNIAKVFPKHTLKAGIFIETSTKRQTATIVKNGRLLFNTDSANPGDTGWDYSNILLGNFQTFDQSNTYRTVAARQGTAISMRYSVTFYQRHQFHEVDASRFF